MPASTAPRPDAPRSRPLRLVMRALDWYCSLPCRCGHPRDAHDHYRIGDECALCDTCMRWRPGLAGLVKGRLARP
jgi:hypothetical protein